MKEWTSSASYATRVAHITGTPGGLNGSYFLNAATVGNDSNMKDTLIGNSAAMDLFFQSMNDVISGKKSDETLIQI
jgi:hypothetical protein